MMVDVDRALSRVMERASWARSLGLVWMVLAWLEREVKHRVGYIVVLQEVLINSLLVFPAALVVVIIKGVKARRTQRVGRK